MQGVEGSVKSSGTSRRKELTIVLVELSSKRVFKDSTDVFVDFERQIVNLFGEFACFTGREKCGQFVLNSMCFSIVEVYRRVMLHLFSRRANVARSAGLKSETTNVR